jgi:excisionase family DNA binding protein
MVTDTQEHKRLMRVREVAAELDQSVSAVYRKVKNGEIPAVRLGSSPRSPLRIERDELDLWLFRQPPGVGVGDRAGVRPHNGDENEEGNE